MSRSMGWLQRLSDGLTKTRDVVRGSLDRLLGRAADPVLLEEFEAALIASDLGARVVDRVMERLKKQLQGDRCLTARSGAYGIEGHPARCADARGRAAAGIPARERPPTLRHPGGGRERRG